MSIRMAELEEKVKNLTQKIAIQNHETGNEIENLKVKVGNNENDQTESDGRNGKSDV